MAQSKFAYVRSFELDDILLPQQWIAISVKRLKGEDKDQFLQSFEKRNSTLSCFIKSCEEVMNSFIEVKLGYITYDAVTFLFKKETTLYQRRHYKLLTYIVSLLSAAFMRNLSGDVETLVSDPVKFVGKVHLFPTDQLLRDFLSSVQCEYHMINLRNTLQIAFNEAPPAEDSLDVNDMAEKDINETLFTVYKINYNTVEEQYKKGSVLYRCKIERQMQGVNGTVSKSVSTIVKDVVDFKQDKFWLNENVLDSGEKTTFNGKARKCSMFSKYAVVDKLSPHSWAVVRIDGKAFHTLSQRHSFAKPNDAIALQLMNVAACDVMKEFADVVISFGESDEYSFVFHRYNTLTGIAKECSALASLVVSIFTSSYVLNWDKIFSQKKLKENCGNESLHFKDESPQEVQQEIAASSPLKLVSSESSYSKLQYSPCFDGRIVFYPTNTSLRDYLSWRQADCHINNMFNTLFWNIIQKRALTNVQAEEYIRMNARFSDEKRSLMLEMGMDYDHEPKIFRKGSVLLRMQPDAVDVAVMPGKDVKCSPDWWNEECENLKTERKHAQDVFDSAPNKQNKQKLSHANIVAERVFRTLSRKFDYSKKAVLEPLVESVDESGNASPQPEWYNEKCELARTATIDAQSLYDLSKNDENLQKLFKAKQKARRVCSLARRKFESAKQSIVSGPSHSDSEPCQPATVALEWWNDACKEAKQARTEARKLFSNSPSDENLKNLNNHKKKAKRVFDKASRQYKAQHRHVQDDVEENSTPADGVSQRPEWWNDETEVAKEKRKLTEKAFKIKPTEENRTLVKQARINAKSVYRSTQKEYKLQTTSATLNGSVARSDACVSADLSETPPSTSNGMPSVHPWWNEQCDQAKVAKRDAQKLFNKFPNAENQAILKTAKNLFKKICKKATKLYDAKLKEDQKKSRSDCSPIETNDDEKPDCSPEDAENASEAWWNEDCNTAKLDNKNARHLFKQHPTEENKKNANRARNRMRRVNVKAMKQHLNLFNSENLANNLSPQCNVENKSVSDVGTPVWWNEECHAAKEIRKSAEKTMKDSPTEENRTLLNQARRNAKTIVRSTLKAHKLSKNSSEKGSEELQTVTSCKSSSALPSEAVAPTTEIKRRENELQKQHLVLKSKYSEIELTGLKSESKSKKTVKEEVQHPASDGVQDWKLMFDNVYLGHEDIIGDHFWNRHTYILGQERSALCFQE